MPTTLPPPAPTWVTTTVTTDVLDDFTATLEATSPGPFGDHLLVWIWRIVALALIAVLLWAQVATLNELRDHERIIVEFVPPTAPTTEENPSA